MSEPSSGPEMYRVSYSERVRLQLRDLIARAKAQGMGREILTAIKEIDNRLHVYPQFGQPLRDLQLESAQVWIGVVSPLVVQYVLVEEKRQVIVVAPFTPLRGSGLEP